MSPYPLHMKTTLEEMEHLLSQNSGPNTQPLFVESNRSCCMCDIV